jgi:hypothetical protein
MQQFYLNNNLLIKIFQSPQLTNLTVKMKIHLQKIINPHHQHFDFSTHFFMKIDNLEHNFFLEKITSEKPKNKF